MKGKTGKVAASNIEEIIFFSQSWVLLFNPVQPPIFREHPFNNYAKKTEIFDPLPHTI